MSASLAAVAAALDALQGADLSMPGTGELLDLLRGVERQSRKLAGVSVALIGQLDARGLAAPAGARSTADLVRQVISIGKDESSHRTRLADGICSGTGLSGAAVPAKFPLVATAVTAGELAVREAALICSTISRFPTQVTPELQKAAETFLVAQAKALDPKTFKQTAREVALMANPDGTPDDRDAHDKMQFHLGTRREDGLTRCWGLLDDLTAEALRVAFGSMCSPSAERNNDREHAEEPASPVDVDPVPADTSPGESAPEAEVVVAQTLPPDSEPDDGGVGTSGTPEEDGPGEESASASTDPGPPSLPEIGTEEVDLGREGSGVGGRHPPDPPPAGDLGAAPAPAPVPARVTSTDAAEGCPDAGPVWRAPRLPYEWAPLGSVPSDYRSPCPDDPRQNDPFPNDAGAEGTAAPTAAGATPEPDAPLDRRSAGTKRAQALSVMVTKFLDSGVAPSQGGHRPHLTVTIDEQSLIDRTGSARLGFGDRLPAGQLRLLACDAAVIPVVLRGSSEVLDVGRSMRTFSAACRTAILLRDVGCIFPGCDTPGRWAEFHHIEHWADGGLSDLHNGCLICRRHHILIHQDQWRVRMGADRLPEIVPPSSHDLEQRPLRNTLHRAPQFDWPHAG